MNGIRPFEEQPRENTGENREKLKEGLGLSFSARRRDDQVISIGDQIELAETMEIPAAQFDFRGKTDEEVEEARAALTAYRQTHPDRALSIHGANPEIDQKTLDMSTKSRTAAELSLLAEANGESYTVHPPSIGTKLFASIPQNAQEAIVRNYAATLASALKAAIDSGKEFMIGIENMPAKGEDGAWGQNPDELSVLIRSTQEAAAALDVDPETIRKSIGATLDVNHALQDAQLENFDPMLKVWFERLGDLIKIIHIYAPSKESKEFEARYRITLDLAAQYSPNARIFLESKQDAGATEKALSALKKID
ncbi:MAG TPA: hypothetical protein VFT82_01425 [Candidatus Paceibacterota bacterium]|nr:hypothetical protein [Candidatus Paceibacterota bacterium]